MPSESQQKQLTFEEYKQKHLISFEEYEKNIKLYYKDDDTVKIEKSYEAYCKSGYNGYLLELKQFNPGIIL